MCELRKAAINSTGFFADYQTLSAPQNVEVPAGNFEALNFQGEFYRENVPEYEPFNIDALYVNGIGKVFENSTYASMPWQTYFERRLVSYELQ